MSSSQAQDNKKIGVGIIGLSARGGWAASAHVPALRLLPEFEIRALTASTIESAQEAAQKFGVPHYFVDPNDLASHPDVDLVIISVKVPEHYRLVECALRAGKMVYCEWPLGASLDEAIRLDELAREKGVRNFVGLQTRASPPLQYVRDLVQKENYVGEVLSTSMIGSGLVWGEAIDQRNQYLLNRSNGATLLSIPFGNSVDAMCWVLGTEFTELCSTEAIRRTEMRSIETNEPLQNTTPDQVAVNGVLQNGAVASVHYRGGLSRGTNFLWEINGTKGDLVISGATGHLQFANVTIRGATGNDQSLVELPIPDKYHQFEVTSGADPSYAMVYAYQHVLNDIRHGTHLVPTFTDAVTRHRMLDAVEKAAQTGQRQSL